MRRRACALVIAALGALTLAGCSWFQDLGEPVSTGFGLGESVDPSLKPAPLVPFAATATAGVWLPDGEQVLLFARGTDGRAAVSLVRFGGGTPRSLPETPEPRALNYSRLASPISPDGRLVAFASFEGVALLPLDGGAPRPLAGAEASELPIQWSEDGRRLILFDPSVLPARLTEIDLESGRRRLVAEIAPSDLRGVPGITNALISTDLAQRVISFQRFQSDLYLREEAEMSPAPGSP